MTPTLIMTTGPRMEYNCAWVCIYHWPMFFTYLFPKSVYAIKCLVHVRDLQLLALIDWRAGQIESGPTHCVKIIDEGRYRWICRYMVLKDSAYWESRPVAAQQLANMLVRIRNDGWADSTDCTAVFMMFVSTKAYVLFVDVEPYRLTAWGHHWHCWLCSYCHNYNQLRLSPSNPWMHLHDVI